VVFTARTRPAAYIPGSAGALQKKLSHPAAIKDRESGSNAEKEKK
jgi:hypothetical protein